MIYLDNRLIIIIYIELYCQSKYRSTPKKAYLKIYQT